MAEHDDPAERLAAWEDALQAADLAVRLVSDAIRLEAPRPGRQPCGDRGPRRPRRGGG